MKLNILSQTEDEEMSQRVGGSSRAVSDEDLKKINSFLSQVPLLLSVPKACSTYPGLSDKQHKTARDILSRSDYLLQVTPALLPSRSHPTRNSQDTRDTRMEKRRQGCWREDWRLFGSSWQASEAIRTPA
eukprot:767951-Hanusia_phi.AAC.3